MCDHHHHQQHHQHQHQNHHYGVVGRGRGGGDGNCDDHHRPWQPAAARRPNKKSSNARRLMAGHGGGGGCGGQQEHWTQKVSPPPPPPLQPPPPPPMPPSRDFYVYRRRSNGVDTTNNQAVEWRDVSKHFAGFPPYLNDNAEKFKNSRNLPSFNHHLLYYGEMHKLHQDAYVTRNSSTSTSTSTSVKSPQTQLRCCKPWQWNHSYGRQTGTSSMNAYYLSDPQRYVDHAKNIIQEDSLVQLNKADELSRSVWRKYLENRQSVAVYDTKMAMWRRLSELIKNQWPGCGLYMVGSTMNGFGGDVSDADFCLLTGCPSAAVANGGGGGGGGSSQRKTADELHRACGVQRLRNLMGMLENERPNRAADIRIVYAKVPILRFKWTDGSEMDVDLCCNNVVGIRNTHLLYCYSRLDYRVRPLVLTIKLWASSHNINDPKRMTLSSYSLVLMVINFLQCAVPPVLPSLQCIYGMKFSVETNIEFVHMHEQLPSSGWRSDNRQSVGELLLQFFEYYNDFNFYEYAVSVRMGIPIQLETCRMAETTKNDPGQWKFIGIEEPFERTNTARSVHNYNVFIQIKEVISKSYMKLKETKSLDSIFCQSEK